MSTQYIDYTRVMLAVGLSLASGYIALSQVLHWTEQAPNAAQLLTTEVAVHIAACPEQDNKQRCYLVRGLLVDHSFWQVLECTLKCSPEGLSGGVEQQQTDYLEVQDEEGGMGQQQQLQARQPALHTP